MWEAPMRFGIFYDIRNPQRWFKPFPQFYAETLDHMQAMDELGFEAINVTEHHFDEDGYCPSVLLWNAAAATRTKRALLGQEILVLPLHHPVRIAEDLATIDNLSNGRAWLRVGQGAPGPTEFAAFGIEGRRRGDRLAEYLDIMRRCFTDEEFSYDGRYYQLRNVRVMPKPVQVPHPPIFVVATPGTPSMERVVRMGLHAIYATGGPQGLPDAGAWNRWHTAWAETVQRHGKQLSQFQTSDFTALFVTEDPERDWRKHRDGVLHALQFYRQRGSMRWAYDTPEDIPNWQNLFQTPDDAVTYLRRQYGDHPPTWLILWANRPGMTYEESAAHHRLFMEKVAPHLKDLD
jgi:alkanesulfonate monooxygenase SsuD/methylene tetrahydromethanopterin reductase-like flavin-dependent oxidoreductase (luciferase family)